MCTTDSQIKSLKSRLRMLRRINRTLARRTFLALLGVLTVSCFASANSRAESTDWELKNTGEGGGVVPAPWAPDLFSPGHPAQPPSRVLFLPASEVVHPRQSPSDDPPLPAYLQPFNPTEEVPPPPVP